MVKLPHVFLASAWLALSLAVPHDGPDPIGSWRLSKRQLRPGRLTALIGADAALTGPIAFEGNGASESLWFDGENTRALLAADITKSKQELPRRYITIEAIVAINERTRWGGILSALQDNGNFEKGWILGYDTEHFYFGLSTKGADDGDGKMSYLRSKQRYEEGRLYHVVATYNGEAQRIYVNGKLSAESRVQSGDILYPKRAPMALGCYLDDDERHPMKGRIHSVKLFKQAAKAPWVRESHAEVAELIREKPYFRKARDFKWLIHPYLQWATRDGMTIRWETSLPSKARVRFAKRVRFEGKGESRRAIFAKDKTREDCPRLGELRLDKLEEDTAYYYRVELEDDRGRTLRSPILSFQTAPPADSPFAFAVISDTQTQAPVAARIAKHAWALRPNFLLHPGDLVSTGSVKRQWTQEFFKALKPLVERVAFFPVLGNHEQDARLYYDYMSLPSPEYYYTFRYANAQFFLLDSNRSVARDSEQYAFLERELRTSKAQWKIVCYHHPAYSSDENDYGDTWSGPSSRGDLRVRALVPLYDKYGVDLVWNGHIHSYERTWPLRAGKPSSSGIGTIYMITGGGGGGLETPGPIRPRFQNTVRRGHHFCMVAVNGGTLEMKAYDLEGRLFDTLVIDKRRKR